MMRISDPRAAIRAYVARGWRVLPCEYAGKSPLGFLAPRGVYSATLDAERLVAALDAAGVHEFNVGIATGRASGIVVLDVDPRHGGEESLALLEREIGPLPATYTVRTGGGGLHLYFRVPEDWTGEVRSIPDLLPGLELKGDGAYVIAPPSLHPSGNLYEILTDGDLAPAPLALLRRRPARRIDIAGVQFVIPEGMRNTELARYAGSLRAQGLPGEAIYVAIVPLNEQYCRPKLPDEELRRIAFGMERYPPVDPEKVLGDLDHARIAASLLRPRWRYVRGIGWLRYRNGVWRSAEESELRVEVGSALRDFYEAAAEAEKDEARRGRLRDLVREVAGGYRRREFIGDLRGLLIADPDRMNRGESLLNVANGMVDLRTGSLLPHDPERLITVQAPVEFNPEARAPKFEAFLQEIFLGDADLIAFILRLFGMMILGGNPERVFVVFWGDGRNGKSTLLKTMKAALGDYVGSIPWAEIVEERHVEAGRASPYLASMVGRRIAMITEPPEAVRFSASTIKSLTGNDVLAVRPLYGRPFEFCPEFTPIVLTNHRPSLDGLDHALWDRMLLVPFVYQVPDDKKIPHYERVLLQEAPGILRMLVDAAREYLQSGLRPPEIVRAATRELRLDDPLYRFIAMCLERDPRAATPFAEIQRAAQQFFGDEGAPSPQALTRALQRAGFQKQHTRAGKIYRGCRLRGEFTQMGFSPDGENPDMWEV
jgi:putative DNA primase/helicase